MTKGVEWIGSPLNHCKEGRRVTRSSGLSNFTYYKGAKLLHTPYLELFPGSGISFNSSSGNEEYGIIISLYADEMDVPKALVQIFYCLETIKEMADFQIESEPMNQVFFANKEYHVSLKDVNKEFKVLDVHHWKNSTQKKHHFLCKSGFDSETSSLIDLPPDWLKKCTKTQKQSWDFSYLLKVMATTSKKTDKNRSLKRKPHQYPETDQYSEGEVEEESDNASSTENDYSTPKISRKVSKQKKTITRNLSLLSRETPLKLDKNNFQLAKDSLHLSAKPNSLPGREDEFFQLLGYIEQALEDHRGTCIYVSGVPGTGKTETVTRVLEELENKYLEDPSISFLELNGLALSDSSQVFVELWRHHSGQKQSCKQAISHLNRYYSSSNVGKRCLLVIDEFDALVNRKQSVLYNLFEWTSLSTSHLLVIAIANTMDLPERMLSGKVSSRMGLTRINFSPYSFQQLEDIVASRLSQIKAFDPDAIRLCSRKVSAFSGDARRALEICRRGIEIAERKKKDQKPETNVVTMEHIDLAAKEMFSTPSFLFIRNASKHEKIFLVAILRVSHKTGNADVDFQEVIEMHQQLCQLHNLNPLTISDYCKISSSLASSRLILSSTYSSRLHQTLRLNINESDIHQALKNLPDVQGISLEDFTERMRALGYPNLIPMDCFRTANFELVADILFWLAKRYDPQLEITNDVSTEQDRIIFTKAVAQFMALKAHIKLNTRKLYAADGYCVKELLKVVSVLYEANNTKVITEDEESNYLVPLDITGKLAGLKTCRKLASEITAKGADLYDLLGQEMELKESRVAIISRPLEIQNIEKSVTDCIQSIQDQVSMTKTALENLAADESNLQAKIEKKKLELDRREKRLKSLQTVRPAFMDEFERIQTDLQRYYEIYMDRYRNLTYLEQQLDEYHRQEQDKFEETESSLKRMQHRIREEELRMLRGEKELTEGQSSNRSSDMSLKSKRPSGAGRRAMDSMTGLGDQDDDGSSSESAEERDRGMEPNRDSWNSGSMDEDGSEAERRPGQDDVETNDDDDDDEEEELENEGEEEEEEEEEEGGVGEEDDDEEDEVEDEEEGDDDISLSRSDVEIVHGEQNNNSDNDF